MTPEKAFARLRAVLLFSGITWGVSLIGVVVSWQTAVDLLSGLGMGTINHDRMLDYWLRMASAAFGFVGVLFLELAREPRKHRFIIPYFGYLMLFEGAVLAWHGLRLKLPPLPFCADTAACFLAGVAILALHHSAFGGGNPRS